MISQAALVYLITDPDGCESASSKRTIGSSETLGYLAVKISCHCWLSLIVAIYVPTKVTRFLMSFRDEASCPDHLSDGVLSASVTDTFTQVTHSRNSAQSR